MPGAILSRSIVLLMVSLFVSSAHANSLPKIVFSCAYPDDLPIFQQVKSVYKTAFFNLGYDFDMIPVSTSRRSLQDSERGVIDGECGRTADLPMLAKGTRLMKVDVLLLTTEFGIWGRSNTVRVSPEDLNKGNYSLAYYEGSLILERYIKENHLAAQKVLSTELGLKMLAAGRFDLLLMSSDVAYEQVNQLGLSDKVVKVGVLSRHNIYPYIHSKHKALIPQLTEELKKLLPPKGIGSIDIQ